MTKLLRGGNREVLLNGMEQLTPVSKLQIRAQVLIKPEEMVLADGLIIEGYSTLNKASITGKSMPVEKTVINKVFKDSY